MPRQRLYQRLCSILLAAGVLAVAALSCTEADQAQVETAAVELGETAVAAGKELAKTQAAQIEATAVSKLATEMAGIAAQLAGNVPLPWDTSWLPSDSQHTVGRMDSILSGTGLDGKGEVILANAVECGVNPAFALAMFRKEASFARPDSRAHDNKNPGNIIATGDCKGLVAGSACNGHYGEVGTDGRFGKYATMDDGIKAYFTLLSTEYKPGTTRDCTGIDCIITAYCPPSDCDTADYISQITEWTRQYQEQILTP